MQGRHCAKCFTFITSFCPYRLTIALSNSVLLSSCYSQGNGGSERLNSSPRSPLNSSPEPARLKAAFLSESDHPEILFPHSRTENAGY